MTVLLFIRTVYVVCTNRYISTRKSVIMQKVTEALLCIAEDYRENVYYSGTPLIRTPLLQYFDTFCCPKCHVCVLYNP